MVNIGKEDKRILWRGAKRVSIGAKKGAPELKKLYK
jgi:hypothetical protein